jgi:hypothetical protein
MKRWEATERTLATGHKIAPAQYPPKKIKFQKGFSVELEKHFTLVTTTAAFHTGCGGITRGAPLLRNPCNSCNLNILAKPPKLREPPPLA